MGRSDANDAKAFPVLLTTLSGLLPALLGSVVILGWYIQSETLIQILPLFVPMQFNTALAFLLCGAGLLSARHFNPSVTSALGVAAAGIGLLTMSEYLFGVDFGIDQLFMQPYIIVETSHPGRMGPNTALCFTLTGGALFMAGVPVTSRRSLLIIRVLGSLVLGLGVIAFVGYVVNLETAYGWGHLGEMAVHTALGFVVLGIGMTAYAWSKEKPDTLGVPSWLPWSIGIGVLTITISLWQALEAAQEVHGHLFVLIFGGFLAGALSLVFNLAEKSKQGEQRLRSIFESSPIGISIFSPETNRRLYMNPAMVELFGAESEEQLLEQDIRKTWANPSDLDRLRETDLDHFTEEIEVERLRLDGTKWWCHLHRRRIEFEGQNALINWHYDITERKRAEEKVKGLNEELEQRIEERTGELRKSESLFRAVVNHSPTKIHIKDIDGRYTLINKEAEKLFGVTNEEVRGKTAHDLFEKHVADAFIAHDHAVIESGKAFEEEEEFTLEDGVHTYLTTKFPIIREGEVTAIGAIGTDITKRKRAEDALRESEIRLYRSMLYAPIPIIMHAEDGEVLMISKRWTDLSGYSLSDIPTIQDWIEKAYGADKELMKRQRGVINKLYDLEEPNKHNSYITTASGEKRIWEVHNAPLRRLPDGRRFIISMALDITDREKTADALRESEARLHRSVLYAPNPIMIHAEGGEVLMINKRWTELSGYAHSDISTIFDWIDKAYGANREHMRKLIGDLYEIEEPFEDEAFITTASGKQRVWDFRTAPLGKLLDGRRFVISMAVDVTERQNVEKSLRDSEERFRSAFENVAIGNIVINDRGVIEMFNAAAGKIFGYRLDEVIGENISILIPEPDQSNHNQYIRKYLETGKANIVGIGREVTGLRKNGEEFPMHLGVGEMLVGDTRSFVGSISDLTEIRILEAKLQQSQKMEAVGQLTGGIAHDFNNMLAVIVGNLELAQQSDSVRADSQLIELITMAIDASDRAGALTDQLLSFSRQQTLSSRIIDATEAVRDSLKLIKGALGADIEIETLLSKEALLIRIDPAMFGNALLNLTLNARDAMPEGGKLTIKTKSIELNRGQLKENPMRIHGLHALISVSDTGVGIDKDNLDRVVEPFFTTKDVGEGSGLGLSMVYGFIEQSGGVMEINSEIGSGTEVAFYLPLVNEEDEKAQKKTEADSAYLSEHREKVILVVEDDLSVLRTISRILMREGYEVIEAVNGLSAGKILDEKSDAIDMVFSDVVMPGSMNGVQLAEWVRRKYKHIRVLLTSGYSDVANQTSSKAMKYEILNKPYKKDQLLKAIEESFNR